MPQPSTNRLLIALAVSTAMGTAIVACVPDVAVRRGGVPAPAVAPERPLAALPRAAPTPDSTAIGRLAASPPALRPRWTTAPPATGGPAPRGLPASLRDSLPSRVVESVLHSVRGEATYYADRFEGRETASGTLFSQDDLVAAHRGFPFGTLLRVTNTRNRRSVQVRVVDRGPWGARAAARNTIIDLSRRAARQLGYLKQGRAQVRVEVLEWGPGEADGGTI